MQTAAPSSDRIKLHPNGPTCSRIVSGVMKWGRWGHQLSTPQIRERIDACLELGITTFDHADIYGDYTTEANFGQALKEAPSLREHLELVTKCGIKLVTPQRPEHQIKSYDTSAAYIRQAVEKSLRNLHTEYLDLLLIHRPSPLMDADEIAEVFTELRKSGKVLHFGVSNFTPTQFNLLHSRFPLVTNQVRISATHLDPFLDGTLDQAQQTRCAPMAWSPLGGAKVFQESTDPTIIRVQHKMNELAQRWDVQPEQVLIAWLLKHPANILPVLGTARRDRLTAAIEALQIRMSREEWFELWSASTGKEVP
jgi:predicted oxidoreductase